MLSLPASISAAAALTSIVCDAAETSPPGPPAKKLAPPSRRVPSSAVRKSGAPYLTAVNVDSTVQPGSGTCVELSAAPGGGLCAGVHDEVPARDGAKAGEARRRVEASEPTSTRPCMC